MSARQDAFLAALLDPARPAPEGLTDGRGRPAGKRFDVYRNNVVVSLTAALRAAFPVITRLLGRANMDRLARDYLTGHLPETPRMMFFGQAFPGYLQARADLAHLGYLADVARLELALRESYHAADAAPMPPEDLAALPPADLMRARLRPVPALRLLRSPWPIHAIWRFNSEEGAPKPRPGGQDVVITRPDFDPVPHGLPPGGGAWLAAILAGEDLATAQQTAEAAQPGFDPTDCLALLLREAALAGVDLSGADPSRAKKKG